MPRRLIPFLAIVLFASASHAQPLAEISDALLEIEQTASRTAGKTVATEWRAFAPEGAITGAAIQGVTPDRELRAYARFAEAGQLIDWRPMHVVWSATENLFVAGLRFDGERRVDRLEFRLERRDDSRLDRVHAGVFTAASGEPRSTEERGLRPLPNSAAGVVIPPPLITRSEWGAEPFRGTPVSLARPDYIHATFHHAAGYNAENKEQGLVQLRAIQDLHQNIRGWSDIGYQFVIDRAGNLYQGRPFLSTASTLEDLPVLAMGAHVGGANTGNIGVSMLGCYHPPEGAYCTQEITEEAWETYVTLFAFISERYGVPVTAYRGHRDFSSTACPGDNNYVLLPDLRTQAAQLMQTGNQPLGAAAITAVTDAAGVVQLSWTFLANDGISAYRIERWVGDDREVIFEGEAAQDATFADSGVLQPGQVSYRLYALGTDGREQRLASVEVEVDTPSGYLFADAFPNPASSHVDLRYSLRAEGVVRLDVYDTVGRRVAQLVNGLRDADSWHVARLPVASLPSGTYFARMVVEGFGGTSFEEVRSVTVVR